LLYAQEQTSLVLVRQARTSELTMFYELYVCALITVYMGGKNPIIKIKSVYHIKDCVSSEEFD